MKIIKDMKLLICFLKKILERINNIIAKGKTNPNQIVYG